MPPKELNVSMTPITSEAEWAKVQGEADFEADMLHMVEVFASWCGPSEAITSTFKKLYVAYQGRKVKFWQVNADTAPYLEKYALSARPYFLFFKDGAPPPPIAAAAAAAAPHAPVAAAPRPPVAGRARAGRAREQVEVVEGVNAPVITKLVADHIPEGMVDTGDDDAAGEGDEEED